MNINTTDTIRELSNILIEVRNNPELNRAVMAECESIYSEMFIHHEVETGAEIIDLK